MSARDQPKTHGARIALVHTTDNSTRLQPNAMGTVLHVDDAGTVHVEFDTGETLGLIPGEDVWRALPVRWDSQPMVRNRTADARRARVQQLNTHVKEQDGQR